MELHDAPTRPGRQRHWLTRTTVGSAWQRRHRATDDARVEAPGTGGPIETWIASPPGAGDRAAADDRRRPRWAARCLGAGTAPRGRAAGRPRAIGSCCPNIRGSATYGRGLDPSAARRLGRGRRRRRPRGARPRHRSRSGRPRSSRRPRPELRRVHGQLARRHDRSVPRGRLGEWRHQPGLGLGRVGLGTRIRPRRPAGRSVHARGDRTPLAPVATSPRHRRSTRRCCCSRPRTTCAVRRMTTSSCSSPSDTSVGRSSTSCTRTSPTSSRRAADLTGGSTGRPGCSTGLTGTSAAERQASDSSGRGVVIWRAAAR